MIETGPQWCRLGRFKTATIREQKRRYETDGNLQGSVADSRNLDGRVGSLLRENAPETDNLIAPRLECWPVQLKRNALTNY
jgi:hypothetical protein